MAAATNNVVRVWAGMRRLARCQRQGCRLHVMWRCNVATGKWLPFNKHAAVLHTERDETKGITIDVLSRDDLHFTACAAKRHATAQGANR